jgi:hypothetical protein
MTNKQTLRALIVFTLACASVARLSADSVETKSGSRVTGKITKIDAGTVTIDTNFAGTLTIKQSEVTAISTDAPVAVRLASGTRIDGTVSMNSGAVVIAGADGTVTTTIGKVAASWTAGAEDPDVTALRRSWSYEASADVTGKSGNKSELGTAAHFRATLTGPSDILAFYTGYDREVSEGVKSADQFKAGVDYSNNFSGSSSWYVRDEGGFDRIQGIQFYDIAAAGYGYDMIKETNETLTGRLGLSFRDDTYSNPLTPAVNDAGLDVGINHTLTLSNSSLVNRITFVPAFNDFSNFILTHESFYELPLANPNWKIRFGVSNNYISKPGVGLKKLDTSYFTRMVLDWK